MRTDSPDTPTPPTARTSRRFVLAATLAALWVIVLGTLSLLTANPVTLNRDQILEAADVITAVVELVDVEDVDSGRVRVEKSWKGVIREDKLELFNLIETSPAVGARLLIPVSRHRQKWRVTLSKLPGEPPLVYPVNEESEQQLRHLLKHGRLP